MLGRTALAAAHAIRSALGSGDAAHARTLLNAYTGPSRLPLTALVHGAVRTQRPLIAAVAVENHIENAQTLRTSTLQAYISSLSAAQASFFNQNISTKAPTSAALTILAAARRSRRQQRTSHMYDSAIRACLLQGEILTGSLLFVLLVRDWQKRHTSPTEPPPEPPPPTPKPALNRPLLRWKRSFPNHYTSPIPTEAPPPPFPCPHLLESIIASLDLRPRKHPQTTDSLPPGRPPDPILALAHFSRLFAEGLLPFGRVAALLNAMAAVPACPEQEYFRNILRLTISNPPEIDTRSYNVLVNYALTTLEKPKRAKEILDHMTLVRQPPLRVTDTTRAILFRGEAKLRRPGLASRILAHIDSRGHDVRLPTNSSSPSSTPTILQSKSIQPPSDPHLLAAYIHNITSIGRPAEVLPLVFTLIPELNLPPPPSRASFKSATKRAITLGPSVLTTLLNALGKTGKTGLAERVWRLGCAAQSHTPSFELPLAFHTILLQLYAREARKGLVVVTSDSTRTARSVVDVSVIGDPPPSAMAYGWGFATPLPDLPELSPQTIGQANSRARRWLLARHSAAEVYMHYIRPYLPLSANPKSKHQLIPDARLWNAIFDTFGRRAQMFVRTDITSANRRRMVRANLSSPKETDAFIRVVLQDMCECDMISDIPIGWRHLIAPEWRPALPPSPPSNPSYIHAAQRRREWKRRQSREKQGLTVPARWRVRETRQRLKFGCRNVRALAWSRKSVHANWKLVSKAARRIKMRRQNSIQKIENL
ncbi:hypothetical protein RhiJN_00299 [Ceratobasidium sp. AG-Ba]|nr:hypothetical protein RhiJN_00299 [Ceratobasidium sp. AG-Ba]